MSQYSLNQMTIVISEYSVFVCHLAEHPLIDLDLKVL